MNRLFAAAFGAALMAAPAMAQAPAQIDFSKIEIKTTPLGNGLYMLEGTGGNITVAAAKDGFIMVDAEYVPLYDKIAAAIKAFTGKPVRYLVNTHVHRDHSNGNPAWGKAGAVIVTQDNVRTRLGTGYINAGKEHVPPMAPEGMPTITYPDHMTLRLDGQTAELTHQPNAHTDGDTTVYFPGANVLSTGDIFTSNRYPNIDVMNGGGIDGVVAALDRLLAFVKDDTKIVPGHGPLANKAKLVEYRTMMATLRDRVAKLKAAGKSEDETAAAKPSADFDKTWAQNADAGERTVRLMYKSVKAR